jgi:hypothetical protein
MGFKKSVIYADFKMGLFIFVSSSVQKLEPKNTICWEVPKKSTSPIVQVRVCGFPCLRFLNVIILFNLIFKRLCRLQK